MDGKLPSVETLKPFSILSVSLLCQLSNKLKYCLTILRAWPITYYNDFSLFQHIKNLTVEKQYVLDHVSLVNCVCKA